MRAAKLLCANCLFVHRTAAECRKVQLMSDVEDRVAVGSAVQCSGRQQCNLNSSALG